MEEYVERWNCQRFLVGKEVRDVGGNVKSLNNFMGVEQFMGSRPEMTIMGFS